MLAALWDFLRFLVCILFGLYCSDGESGGSTDDRTVAPSIWTPSSPSPTDGPAETPFTASPSESPSSDPSTLPTKTPSNSPIFANPDLACSLECSDDNQCTRDVLEANPDGCVCDDTHEAFVDLSGTEFTECCEETGFLSSANTCCPMGWALCCGVSVEECLFSLDDCRNEDNEDPCCSCPEGTFCLDANDGCVNVATAESLPPLPGELSRTAAETVVRVYDNGDEEEFEMIAVYGISYVAYFAPGKVLVREDYDRTGSDRESVGVRLTVADFAENRAVMFNADSDLESVSSSFPSFPSVNSRLLQTSAECQEAETINDNCRDKAEYYRDYNPWVDGFQTGAAFCGIGGLIGLIGGPVGPALGCEFGLFVGSLVGWGSFANDVTQFKEQCIDVDKVDRRRETLACCRGCCLEDQCPDGSCKTDSSCPGNACPLDNGCCAGQTLCDNGSCVDEGACCEGTRCPADGVCCKAPARCMAPCGQCIAAEFKCCTDGSVVPIFEDCETLEQEYPPPGPPPGRRGQTAGDPHLITFDGLKYDCQANGLVTLVKSLSSNFEIQAWLSRVPGRPSGAVTWTRGFAVRDGFLPVLQLWYREDQELEFLVDGVPNPLQDGNGYLVRETGFNRLTIELFTGVTLTLKTVTKYSYMDLDVAVAGKESETLIGLLGSPNDDISDDWMTPDGTPIAVPTDPADLVFDPAYNYCTEHWCVANDTVSLFAFDNETLFEAYKCDGLPYGFTWNLASAPQCLKALCGNGTNFECLIEGFVGGREAVDQLFDFENNLFNVCTQSSAKECYFSCAEALDMTCDATSGVLSICPSGNVAESFDVYCDQETDGGGWMLLYSYKHVAENLTDVVGDVIPTDPDDDYSHFFLQLVGYQANDIEDVRFYCTSSDHDRVIHFKSDHPFVKSLAMDGNQIKIAPQDPEVWTDTRCYVRLMDDHTARLPLSTNFLTGTSLLDDGGFHYWPFWEATFAHWSIHAILFSGDSPRYECDDSAGGFQRDTRHNVWVKIASSPL